MAYLPPYTNYTGSKGLFPDEGSADSPTLNYPAINSSDGSVSNLSYRAPFCGFTSASTSGANKFETVNSITASAGTCKFRTYNAADAADGPSSIILGFDMNFVTSAYGMSAYNEPHWERIGDFDDIQFIGVMQATGDSFVTGDLYIQASLDGGFTWTHKYYNQDAVANMSVHNFRNWENEFGGTLNSEIKNMYGGANGVSKLISKGTGSLKTYHPTVFVSGGGPIATPVVLSAHSSSYPPLSHANLTYITGEDNGFTTMNTVNMSTKHTSKHHLGRLAIRLGFKDDFTPNTSYWSISQFAVRLRFNATTPIGKTEIKNGEWFLTQKGLIEIASGSVKVQPDPTDGTTP